MFFFLFFWIVWSSSPDTINRSCSNIKAVSCFFVQKCVKKWVVATVTVVVCPPPSRYLQDNRVACEMGLYYVLHIAKLRNKNALQRLLPALGECRWFLENRHSHPIDVLVAEQQFESVCRLQTVKWSFFIMSFTWTLYSWYLFTSSC